MKPHHLLVTAGLLLGLVTATSAPAKPLSDLVSPEKRKSTVDQAQRLTRVSEPAPLQGDLVHPFNPNFDQPDPEELRAAAAASARAGGVTTPPPGPGGAAVQPTAPAGDREILESIATKIRPNGMIKIGNSPARLTFGRQNVEVGGTFNVTNPANGQDYTLELIAIEPPTFTLRYRNEEITRPIKSGK